MNHTLKTLEPFFANVFFGLKPFEVRKDDREFNAGDTVLLRQYDLRTGRYPGWFVFGVISYVLRTGNGHFVGVRPDYAVLGIKVVKCGKTLCSFDTVKEMYEDYLEAHVDEVLKDHPLTEHLVKYDNLKRILEGRISKK